MEPAEGLPLFLGAVPQPVSFATKRRRPWMGSALWQPKMHENAAFGSAVRDGCGSEKRLWKLLDIVSTGVFNLSIGPHADSGINLCFIRLTGNIFNPQPPCGCVLRYCYGCSRRTAADVAVPLRVCIEMVLDEMNRKFAKGYRPLAGVY